MDQSRKIRFFTDHSSMDNNLPIYEAEVGIDTILRSPGNFRHTLITNPQIHVHDVIIGYHSSKEIIRTYITIWESLRYQSGAHQSIASPAAIGLVDIWNFASLYRLASVFWDDWMKYVISCAVRRLLDVSVIAQILSSCGSFDNFVDPLRSSEFTVREPFEALVASFLPWIMFCMIPMHPCEGNRLLHAIENGSPGMYQGYVPVFLDRHDYNPDTQTYHHRRFVTKCSACGVSQSPLNLHRKTKLSRLGHTRHRGHDADIILHERRTMANKEEFVVTMDTECNPENMEASVNVFILNQITNMSNEELHMLKEGFSNEGKTPHHHVILHQRDVVPVEYLYKGKCSTCGRSNYPVYIIALMTKVHVKPTDLITLTKPTPVRPNFHILSPVDTPSFSPSFVPYKISMDGPDYYSPTHLSGIASSPRASPTFQVVR